MDRGDKASAEELRVYVEYLYRKNNDLRSTMGDWYEPEHDWLFSAIFYGWITERPFDYTALAHATGTSVQTIRRRCEALEKSGLVVVEAQGKRRTPRPSEELLEAYCGMTRRHIRWLTEAARRIEDIRGQEG